jgi:hypothetical protein
MKNLQHILEIAGKPTEVLAAPDGTRILLLPHGGRILGLYAPDSEENFLWTNRALDAADSAMAFFESEEWCNSGGDRTWLAPEVDFFFPKFPNTNVYFQCRSLDPGHYEVKRSAEAITLRNHLTISSSRAKEELDLTITRRVECAENPLRFERSLQSLVGQVSFAGYTLKATLELHTPESQAAVGLWSLLQLPHGGQMLVSTYSATKPIICFGNVPTGELTAEPRLVRYWMRSSGDHKIGVRALACTGRVGYLRCCGNQSTVVVRSFHVNPSGLYADVPWSDTNDLGYAVQACNINNAVFGKFSEMEYHAPAIGGTTGLVRSEDTSQVWAFRGETDKIKTLANALIGEGAAKDA